MSDSHHSATNSAAWNRRRLLHAGGLAAVGSLAITSLSSPTLANENWKSHLRLLKKPSHD